MELYMAPDGCDQWSGLLTERNAEGTDGPLATLAGARDRIRALRKRKGVDPKEPVTVTLRGGVYTFTDHVVFTPDDGWVRYAACAGEIPVFQGGEVITGFRVGKLHGRQVWIADLPDVAAERWYFKSLFVNGVRRPRPYLPRKGYYRIASLPGVDLDNTPFHKGSSCFQAAPGDVRAYRNLQDVEALVHHYWVEERLPIESFDPADNIVRSSRRSVFAMRLGHGPELAEYRLENIFEALKEPGEWYLDRGTGRLYYLPRPGERFGNTEVIAPRLTQFVRVEGNGDRPVEGLGFHGIRMTFADWRPSRGGMPHQDLRGQSGELFGSDAQSALTVEGAIAMRGARRCAVENCELSHLGGYAMDLGQACFENRLVGNTLFDLGAGGIKLHGGHAASPPASWNGNNQVTDNHIHHIGEVFKAGCGILSGDAFGNTFSHNHIHHTHYSGISVGWVWGYGDSVSRDNRIEFNHIHHIGRGLLSDMGGIYTLGVQPGTVLRNNLIHHVRTAQYGGWAIYPDEGSAHLVIENNVCYQTDSAVFNIHYGREIIARNNIFAFGGEGIFSLGRSEDHNACTIHNNLFVTAGEPLHAPGYACRMETARYRSDDNWIFDLKDTRPLGSVKSGARCPLARLRALGFERRSRIGDPGLVDPRRPDRGFKPGAKPVKEGFVPIDLRGVGVRPSARR